MDLVALHQLGYDQSAAGDWQGAIKTFQEAIVAAPTEMAGYVDLADVLIIAGYDQEARAVLDIGLGQIPNSPALLIARCMAAFSVAYANEAMLEAARADFCSRLHGLRAVCFASPEALRESVRAIALKPPFFLPYQGRNDRSLLETHGALVADIMAAVEPTHVVRPRRPRRRREQIRVGIVTGMFWRHSVWRLPVRGWVEGFDRDRFSLIGFHTRAESDDQTNYAAARFDRFVQGRRPLAQWIEAVEAHAPHVLIYPELAMDQISVQLAALRLAPVQCTSWGQPTTSGLPTIDYYLSSDLMEPPNGDEHYTEALVRLPGLGTVFQPEYSTWGDPLPETDGWANLDVTANTVRYFCCQSMQKYLPMYDEIFPRIAMAVPNARFVFVNTRPRATEILWQRLGAAFGRYGLWMMDYCRLVPTMGTAAFSALIRDSDIFLDTIGWSGCNTALDAFRHHVPIVTHPGEMMRGRHALAVLRSAGVMDTVADTVDDYVTIAARLGLDDGLRANISARLAAATSRVFGDQAPVRALEAFLMGAKPA